MRLNVKIADKKVDATDLKCDKGNIVGSWVDEHGCTWIEIEVDPAHETNITAILCKKDS